MHHFQIQVHRLVCLFLNDNNITLVITTKERGVLSSVLDIMSFKYQLLSKVLSKILLKRLSF